MTYREEKYLLETVKENNTPSGGDPNEGND